MTPTLWAYLTLSVGIVAFWAVVGIWAVVEFHHMSSLPEYMKPIASKPLVRGTPPTFPPDVMKAAREAVSQHIGASEFCGTGWVFAAAFAIMAERERCAELVWSAHTDSSWSGSVTQNALAHLAAAIRGQP